MNKLKALYERAQWSAFDEVLNWINEQTEQYINKKDLYAAVMQMRPRPLQNSINKGTSDERL